MANTTSSQDYEQALAAFEGVREEVRQMSEDVDKAERTMLEKQQSMEQDLAEKKRLLADKEASLDAAEKTKEAKRAEAEEAGQLVDKHKISSRGGRFSSTCSSCGFGRPADAPR